MSTRSSYRYRSTNVKDNSENEVENLQTSYLEDIQGRNSEVKLFLYLISLNFKCDIKIFMNK